MASNDIKHPVRARKLETGKVYYPDELVEKNGELYVYNSDGSASIRINKSVNILNSTGAVIGAVNPITGNLATENDTKTKILYYIKGTQPYSQSKDDSIPTIKEIDN